ncbi:MAG: hypothetical protein LBB05_01750 [Puniceicoccales bacterium]|jgi:hypothetical protein|nr:hypothetical protein [Puniceicoccales bacterium]
MNDISRLSLGSVHSDFGVQTQATNPGSSIAPERGNEVIREESGQSLHVALDHRLENIDNGDIVDKICDGIIKAFSALGRILGAIFKGIGKLVISVLDGILALIKALTEKLKEIVNYTRSDIIPLATDTAQGIEEGAYAAGKVMGAIHGAPMIVAGDGTAAILENLTGDQPLQN